jgi:hypothetical protein
MHLAQTLPSTLPEGRPYIFLSALQAPVCARYPGLAPFEPHLPCWVPHRAITAALGFSAAGIDRALARAGRPDV